MLATVKGNVKENTVVIDDEEIDNYMEEMRYNCLIIWQTERHFIR